MRRLATALSITLAISASGCAISGDSTPVVPTSDSIVTGSVTSKPKFEGVAETDAEIIKNTVVALDGKTAAIPLAWSNPDTGSSGAIVTIDQFKGKHGQKCRSFKTTVDTFAGIAFYNGEACQISASEWVLSWFKSVG